MSLKIDVTLKNCFQKNILFKHFDLKLISQNPVQSRIFGFEMTFKLKTNAQQ